MMTVSDDGRGGTILKIVAIVVIISAAGYFSLRGRSTEAPPPDDPMLSTPYICLDDGHVFRLTNDGLEELKARGATKPIEKADIPLVMVECPTTKAISAVIARECSEDKFVPFRDQNGQPVDCP